jgi:hypothetical protein
MMYLPDSTNLFAVLLVSVQLGATARHVGDGQIDTGSSEHSSLSAVQAERVTANSVGGYKCEYDVMVQGQDGTQRRVLADDLSAGVEVGSKTLLKAPRLTLGPGTLNFLPAEKKHKKYFLLCKGGEEMILRKIGYDGEEKDYPFSFFRQWMTTGQKVGVETPFQFDISFQEKYGHMVDSKEVTWTIVDVGPELQCQRLEDEISGEMVKMQGAGDDMQAHAKDFNILGLKRLNELKREHQKLGCPGTVQDGQAGAITKLGAAYVAAHKEADKEAAEQRWELAVAELLDAQRAEEVMSFKRLVKICRMFWGTSPHPEQEGDEELEDRADQIDGLQGNEIAGKLEGKLQSTLGELELESMQDDGGRVLEDIEWNVGEDDIGYSDVSLAQRTDDTKMSDELGEQRGIFEQIVVGAVAGIATVIIIMIVASVISVLVTLLWYAFLAGILVSLGVMAMGVMMRMG